MKGSKKIGKRKRISVVEEEKKYVIVWFSANRKKPSPCYLFERNQHGIIPRPICKDTGFPLSSGFGVVVCGSKIYAFGGSMRNEYGCFEYDRADQFFIYDINEAPCGGWKKHPKTMKHRRVWPMPIAMGNKIYVFGCKSFTYDAPFGEVYDTDFDTWDDLPQPPVDIFENDVGGYAASGDLIIFQLTGEVLTYNTQLKLWSIVTQDWPEFPLLFVDNPVLDGILYTFWSGNVYAYDFSNRKHLGLVMGLKPYLIDDKDKLYPMLAGGCLHSVGNSKLSLVWTLEFWDEGQRKNTTLHSVTFQTQWSSTPGQIQAHNISVASHTIDIDNTHILFSLAL